MGFSTFPIEAVQLSLFHRSAQMLISSQAHLPSQSSDCGFYAPGTKGTFSTKAVMETRGCCQIVSHCAHINNRCSCLGLKLASLK